MAQVAPPPAFEKGQLQAQHDSVQSPSGPSSFRGSYVGQADGADGPERVPSPPPYSSPIAIASASETSLPQNSEQYPGLPRLEYKLYSPPLFELSPDCTTIKSTAPYLSTNASALVSLIRAQSTIPPKPQIHITGTRGRKVDFAIKLNLMNLMVPEDPARRMDYLRCVGPTEIAFRGGFKPGAEPDLGGPDSLDGWCRAFVEEQGAVKTFVLERQVANLDTGWLEGQIRSLVAITDYKGHVTVSFPVTHAKVVVQSPDRVNKFFTSVSTLFSGKKRFEVIRAVWPFASARNGDPGRRCIVMSEERWWQEWRDVIKFAVASKRQGWVTNEDKLEAIMEGKGKGLSIVDWGPEEV